MLQNIMDGKKDLYRNWKDIKITQTDNFDNITIDAGNKIEVGCEVELPNIDIEKYRSRSILWKDTRKWNSRKC